MTQITDNYIATGKVVYIFKNFPLPASMHPQAQISAEAAECGGPQGKFWEMHDKVFLSQDEWSGKTNALEILLGYAAGVGLDESAYQTCMSEHHMAQKIQNDYAYGQRIGVPATPAFLINGKGMTGAQPYDVFQQVIEGELGGGQP